MMRPFVPLAAFASIVSAIPIQTGIATIANISNFNNAAIQATTDNSAGATNVQGKGASNDWNPPPYGPGLDPGPGPSYGYGPPPPSYGSPYQGGGYIPGQYIPPPSLPPPSSAPPKATGSYNGPSALSGLGSIASGVGQVIGGTVGLGGNIVGDVGSDLWHAIGGRRDSVRKRAYEKMFKGLRQLGERVAGRTVDKSD